MTISKSLFSSNKQDWETPQWLFDELNKEFNFDIDLAANSSNAKCKLFCEDIFHFNIVMSPFPGKTAYMNPPYGKNIGKFIEQAYLLSLHFKIVMLIPARTDTKYWHKYIWDNENHRTREGVKEIRFIKGRLKFSNSKNSAPFPSVIIIFDRT